MKSDPILTMIVEDNYEALLLLRQHLEVFPLIKLVATAKSADEASLLYLKHHPSLVFLDIELGEQTGFEFLQNISSIAEGLTVIITTAYNHYAIEAIKNSAFDYLLKPICPEELAAAIHRYLSLDPPTGFREKVNDLRLLNQTHLPLKINKKNGFVLIKPADIIYCKADWNYTEIFLTDHSSHLVTMNLGHLESLLPPEHFLRANRSLILNLNFLHQVNKIKKNCTLKYGSHETTLSLTTSKIRKLENLLDNR